MPKKLKARNEIERIIAENLELSGYKRVETPLLEYLDEFISERGGIENTDIVKTFDAAGNVLALRPDCTIPIARLYETEFKESKTPVRLCYTMDVLGNSPRRQFRQAGAELIGEEGILGDIEMIAMAISSLKDSGMKDFLIEIGQVGFFKGIMMEAGLTDDAAEEVRQCVEEKNLLGIELLLNRIGGEKLSQKLMALPTLFGGYEVIEKARLIADNEVSQKALFDLETIFTALCAMGYEEHISIDLGMVHKINYYTGTIFKGMSGYLGQPLLSGGRYDNLLSVPATGFAVNIDQLALAIERQGDKKCEKDEPIYIIYETSCIAKAYEKANELRKKGQTAIMVHEADSFNIDGAFVLKITDKGGEGVD